MVVNFDFGGLAYVLFGVLGLVEILILDSANRTLLRIRKYIRVYLSFIIVLIILFNLINLL